MVARRYGGRYGGSGNHDRHPSTNAHARTRAALLQVSVGWGAMLQCCSTHLHARVCLGSALAVIGGPFLFEPLSAEIAQALLLVSLLLDQAFQLDDLLPSMRVPGSGALALHDR